MNKLLTIAIIFCFALCPAQNIKHQLEEFKERFKLVLLPFNSSPLNQNQILIQNSKRDKLSDDEVLKHFLSEGSTALYYNYEKYDMETGESKGFEKRPYNFYPVFRIETRDMLILIVLKTSINTQSYFLAIYDRHSGKKRGVVDINKLDAEGEYTVFQESYIDKDLNLKIFRYEVNPEYLTSIKTEANKTIVTEMEYNIENKIKLITKKSKKSKCSVSEFFQRNKKCLNDDPRLSLPTGEKLD